jgi:hypothetical protein
MSELQDQPVPIYQHLVPLHDDIGTVAVGRNDYLIALYIDG